MGFFDFLKPLFGSSSGVLTPFTNRISSKAVGGAGSLQDAFVKSTAGGGALDAINFAKDTAVSGVADIGHKLGAEVSKVPLIGEALQKEVESATGKVKGALEAVLPSTPEQVMATPEAKEAEAKIVSYASKLPIMQIAGRS